MTLSESNMNILPRLISTDPSQPWDTYVFHPFSVTITRWMSSFRFISRFYHLTFLCLTISNLAHYCLIDLAWQCTQLTTSPFSPRPRRDDNTSTWRRTCNIHVSTQNFSLSMILHCTFFFSLVLISSSVTLSVVLHLYSFKFSNVTAQGIQSIVNMRIIELKWKW